MDEVNRHDEHGAGVDACRGELELRVVGHGRVLVVVRGGHVRLQPVCASCEVDCEGGACDHEEEQRPLQARGEEVHCDAEEKLMRHTDDDVLVEECDGGR